MPLEVLLDSMRLHWRAGRLDEAAALAKAAAPYLHAKAVAGRGNVTLSALEDEELDDLCEGETDGAAATAVDTD